MSSLRFFRSCSMSSQQHHTVFTGSQLYRKLIIGKRQGHGGFTACPVGPVGKSQNPSMGFSNLPAQDQPNSAAAVLGGKERNKQIVAIQQSGAFVANNNLHTARVGVPPDFDRSGMTQRRVQRSIRGIANDVDQQ